MTWIRSSSSHLRSASHLLVAACIALAPGCQTHEPDAVTPLRAEEPVVVAESAATQGLRDLLTELRVRWLREERELEIDGWINQTEGAIEVLACTAAGKTHEALLVLDCVPHGLHAGLLAIGLEPGAPARIEADGSLIPPSGPGVELIVRWSDEAGSVRETRAENLVHLEQQDKTMPPTAWVFTGSIRVPEPNGDGVLGYAADETSSLVTTYLDATSVLENPHLGGSNDDAYSADGTHGPPLGTPITLVVRVAEESR